MLARNRSFTVMVVLVLALGIGANAVFFGIVDGVLLRPLPFPDPSRLVVVLQRDPVRKGIVTVSPGAFAQWREHNTVFEHVATGEPRDVILTGGDEPEMIRAGCVSGGFFETLGVAPALGRSFLPEEEEYGRNRVALLSHGLWQRRFGGDPHALGKIMGVNGTELTIIGILPPGFVYPLMKGVDLWAPLTLNRSNFGGHWLQVVARLKPGVSAEQAQAAMDVLAAQIVQEFPEGNEGWTAVNMWTLHQFVLAGRDGLLLALFAATGCVLLIACANVAGLLLARLPKRRKELAVRMAIGAHAGHVARQLVTESLLLALLAGGLGLLLSLGGILFVRTWISAGVPFMENVVIDERMLGFVLMVSALIGVLLGLAQVLQVRGGSLTEALQKETARAAGGVQARRLRAALVTFELAAAVVLLTGGSLMVHSLARRMLTAPGFQPDHLLTLRIHYPPFQYSGQRSAETFHQLLERVEALPAVRCAAGVTYLPTETESRTSAVSEEAAARGAEGSQAAYRAATPGYFRTLGIPLLKGRDFTAEDGPGQPEVAIINERLARLCWPGADPVGKRLKPGGLKGEHPWLTVVGVVANTNDTAPDQNKGSYELEMYRPLRQYPASGLSLVVRTEGDPLTLVRDVRRQVSDVSRNAAVSRIATMRQILVDHLAASRVLAVLPSMFAAAALLLAAVGLYGTISYSVSQRTHEIGVRMALGATLGDVLRLVMRQGLILALIGLTAGLIMARCVVHVVAAYLYQVTPYDLPTFLAVALLLAAVAAAACYIPARRAARIDPVSALRYE
jgi:putative ABC transport system permease protein